MPNVEIPGVGVVEFPDSMSNAEIEKAAAGLASPTTQAAPISMVKQAPTIQNLGQRAANLGRLITTPVQDQGFFGKWSEAATRAGLELTNPEQWDTPAGNQIRDYLSSKGYPLLGDRLKTAIELPYMLGNVGVQIMNALPGGLLSAAGHKANVLGQEIAGALGVPEPVAGTIGTAANIATQFGLPGALTRGAQIAGKVIAPHLPGAQAARAGQLTEQFNTSLGEKMISASQKEQAAKATLAAATDAVPLPKTSEFLKTVIAEEEAGGPPTGALADLKRLASRIQANGGALSPRDLNKEMSYFGNLTKQMRTAGQNPDEFMTALFARMANDAKTPATTVKNVPIQGPTLPLPPPPAEELPKIVMGEATSVRGSEQLAELAKHRTSPVATEMATNPLGYERITTTGTFGTPVMNYRAAVRERKSIEDISDVANRLIKSKQGFDSEFQNMSGPQMLNWMKDHVKNVEAIPEPDLADLQNILYRLAELPAIPPPKGVMYGAGKAAEITGITAGTLILGGASATTGFGVGSLLAGLAAASRALLPTRIGRKALLAVMDSGPVNQTQINMLTSLARAIVPDSLVSSEIKKALKDSSIPLEVKIQAAMQQDQLQQ